jgi:archaemetzincin
MPEMGPLQRAAIGDTTSLPPPLVRALEARGFAPMPRPGPHDWLSVHPERGQTFADYIASAPPLPRGARRALALVPMGEIRSPVPPLLLCRYAEAFFQLPTRLLPAIPVGERQVKTRLSPWTRRRQLRAPDLLALLCSRLPNDVFALAAFTDEDLYPEDSYNFVFGQASQRERVGVFSFARYDPALLGAPRGADHEGAMRRRCMNVLVHEMAHLFGLAHCIYFSCVMNGSNHLEETDRRPQHPCPVCLRKLHHADAGKKLALDLLTANAAQTMSIASTRPGIAAWKYKYSEHGTVISSVTDGQTRPISIAIAVGSIDGVPSIVGLASDDAALTRPELQDFLTNAHADYKAASAAVPEMPAGLGASTRSLRPLALR